ncbi:MAG: sigma-54-dependent Fis family transcriptional regulator [Gemmatimonadales bacterium]|nr:sigma-54-dependent Fis family transcriptional regulator [Gemmatimonadales bacterium]
MTLVLVVDDVAPLAEQYAYDLKRMGGYEVITAGDGRRALETLAASPVDCVLLDLEMPVMDGLEVLRVLERKGSQVPVIVYTGTGNFDRCVQAIRLGAYGFIDKGEPMPRVVHEIESALERRRLRSEVGTLRRQLGRETSLLGSSGPLVQLRETIARVAPVPSPVLVLGESGSGKELVARDLHRFGPYPSGPFLAINCAALPESLVESELFGHERGAFTGAVATRKGAFESAERGTLFLDEIGELPPAAQAKLLRVLEDRVVTRLGGSRSVAVDVRVVAATNRDLEVEIAGGRFRDDLYFRLNVHLIRVPPLRERLSDVPALADLFLTGTCARFGIRKKKIAPEALDLLMGYEWQRNNVRELRNAVERMIIAADGDTIRAEHVPADIRAAGHAERPPSAEGARTFQELKAEAERRIIVSALERHDWHVTRTAAELGLADHASLLKIMRRHNIRRPDARVS